ncbi:hypothetical protein MIB92_15580, partial [Aestuariirhabdus sp. Z084]
EWIWLNNRHRKQRNAGCRYRFSGYRFSTASLCVNMSRHQGKQEERDFDGEELPSEFKLSRSKIMYVEDKSAGLEGEARIGRVYFSKSGKTLYYRGQKFQSLKGSGFKANYFEVESGDHYWISGPRKDQNDRLYGGNRGVEVDDGIYEEYIRSINT